MPFLELKIRAVGSTLHALPSASRRSGRRRYHDGQAKAKAGARAADAPTDSAICAAVSPRSNRAPSHSTWSAGHRRRGAAEERFGGWRLVMPGYSKYPPAKPGALMSEPLKAA